MTDIADFLSSILDSVAEHIVVIDAGGEIQYVNAAWINFGKDNGLDWPASEAWRGVNYLEVCDRAASNGDLHGGAVSTGVREMIQSQAPTFYYEYPCHSNTEKRWFMMRTSRLRWEGSSLFVVTHQNITERKLAEETVQALSLSDGLTGVANRRHFDEVLEAEWRRCARLSQPIALLMLDIDHFKAYNDTYGHQAGDECLRSIGNMLQLFGKRPSDLVARYGGEEFALILGGTSLADASVIANKILRAIEQLAIEHSGSSTANIVTASIGVAACKPLPEAQENELLGLADAALYEAKNSGRNCMVEAQDALSKAENALGRRAQG